MGNPGYIVENLLSALVTFTPSTVDPVYTPDFLFDGYHDIPFRWAAKSNQTLLMQFPEPAILAFIGIANHNLTPDATIALGFGTDPSAGDGFVPITWAEKNCYSIFSLPSPSVGKEFWELRVDDPENDDYPQIGEVLLGVLIELPRQFSFGVQKSKDYADDEGITERGRVDVFEGFDQRSIVYPANNIFPAVESAIAALYDATHGRLRPVFFVPDTDEPEALFGRIASKFQSSILTKATNPETGQVELLYSSGVTITEEADGANVT